MMGVEFHHRTAGTIANAVSAHKYGDVFEFASKAFIEVAL
jgi:hypothetical protein